MWASYHVLCVLCVCKLTLIFVCTQVGQQNTTTIHEVVIDQHVTCNNNLHPITFVVLCVIDIETINPLGFLLPSLLVYLFLLYNLQGCLRPANERRYYFVAMSLIGWVQAPRCRPKISLDLARVLCNWSSEETEMYITTLCSISVVQLLLVGCVFCPEIM